MPQHHITNGIRSGGYSPPPGFRSPRSLRSHGSLHPQFVVAGLCYAKPLFATTNRRIPRTLCEIGFELGCNILTFFEIVG
jgi:hypothetical protein